MKRLLALIVLLGFVGVLAGCNDSGTSTPPGTNAAPAMPAAPSTNK